MNIPKSLYRAKDCTDLADVEIALDALKEWCVSVLKKAPDEVPAVAKRYYALIRLRSKFSR